MSKSIDAAKGKWLSNSSWVVIVIFVSSFAMGGQHYIEKIDSAEKHIESGDKKEVEYTKLILKQGKINVSVAKDVRYLKNTMAEIKDQLIRLKIVKVETEYHHSNPPPRISQNLFPLPR